VKFNAGAARNASRSNRVRPASAVSSVCCVCIGSASSKNLRSWTSWEERPSLSPERANDFARRSRIFLEYIKFDKWALCILTSLVFLCVRLASWVLLSSLGHNAANCVVEFLYLPLEPSIPI
jgi:hypothetical protein